MDDRIMMKNKMAEAGVEPADTHQTHIVMRMDGIIADVESVSGEGLALAYLCPSCPHIHLLLLDGTSMINVKLRDSQAEKLANMLISPGTFKCGSIDDL